MKSTKKLKFWRGAATTVALGLAPWAVFAAGGATLLATIVLSVIALAGAIGNWADSELSEAMTARSEKSQLREAIASDCEAGKSKQRAASDVKPNKSDISDSETPRRRPVPRTKSNKGKKE